MTYMNDLDEDPVNTLEDAYKQTKKLIHPIIPYLLRHINVSKIVRDALGEPQVNGQYFCPWHKEEGASFKVYPDGSAHCFGCGQHISDIRQFVMSIYDLNVREATSFLYKSIVPRLNVSVNPGICTHLDYLKTERNLSPRTISEYQLFSTPEKINIPIRDRFGVWVATKTRNVGTSGPKYTMAKGDRVHVYPAWKVMRERRLLLVEGEFDVLVGRDRGLPTCTITGGAQSWSTWDADLFKDKAVWVLYDNDAAGRRGAVQVAKTLASVGAHQVTIMRPLHETQGKDLTDWSFLVPERFPVLAKRIESFKFNETKKQEAKRCPTCGQIIAKDVL